MFRTKTSEMVIEVKKLSSNDTTIDSDNLVGLDAKIPGGKYDSSLNSTSQSNGEVKEIIQ